MSPPLPVTEDTPPDMLAGSMDLRVVLPGGHNVKMSVDRSTPMMDLLVQVTTANKISPGGHVIQALGERGVLPYKPSTPIGALDTWTIHIVPKHQMANSGIKKAPLKPVNQPFEQTFRLQVHLPRNQLYVSRVSPKARLSDILLQVCSEKNLDCTRYSLRHPTNLDQVLNLKCTLADYKLQEVTLVYNTTLPVEVSTVDIMALQRDASNNYINRNNRSCEGSVSSGSLGGRSLSPVPSDESSASPPPPPPSRPIRKRRPAPKPPTINSTNNMNGTKLQKESESSKSTTVICHSRNSSDSSGYHEASVLSESPQSNSLPDSLPRRSKLPSITSESELTESSREVNSNNLSRSLSSLTAVESSTTVSMKQYQHSISTSSLSAVGGRKKKAAPPPPPTVSKMSSLSEEQQRTPSVSSTASSTTTLDGNEASVLRKSATLPATGRLPSISAVDIPENIPSSPVDASSLEPPQSPVQGRFALSPFRLIQQTKKIFHEFDGIGKNINTRPRSPASFKITSGIKLQKSGFKTSTLPTKNRYSDVKSPVSQEIFTRDTAVEIPRVASSNESRFSLSPSRFFEQTKKIIHGFDKNVGKSLRPMSPSYLKNDELQWRRKHVKKIRCDSNQIDVHFVSNNFSNYINDEKLKLNINDLKHPSKSFNVRIKEMPIDVVQRSQSFRDELIQDVRSNENYANYQWDDDTVKRKSTYIDLTNTDADRTKTHLKTVNYNLSVSKKSTKSKSPIKFTTQYDGRGGSIENRENQDRNIYKSNSLSEKVNLYKNVSVRSDLIKNERSMSFSHNDKPLVDIKTDKNVLNTCESFRLKLEKFNSEGNYKNAPRIGQVIGNRQQNIPIKCNLLAPPPPDLLVNRRESSESWNNFLRQLDDILENRVGEIV